MVANFFTFFTFTVHFVENVVIVVSVGATICTKSGKSSTGGTFCAINVVNVRKVTTANYPFKTIGGNGTAIGRSQMLLLMLLLQLRQGWVCHIYNH
jgi:hypothetical protein